MGDIKFNSLYLRSTHGIIKIVQIVCGFIIPSFLCGLHQTEVAATWYSRSCFSEGRLGYCSGLSSVILLINIIVFILCILNVNIWSLERVYSIIAAILYLIATGVLIWFLVQDGRFPVWLIASAVLNGIMLVLFVWDVKILQGESANTIH